MWERHRLRDPICNYNLGENPVFSGKLAFQVDKEILAKEKIHEISMTT